MKNITIGIIMILAGIGSLILLKNRKSTDTKEANGALIIMAIVLITVGAGISLKKYA